MDIRSAMERLCTSGGPSGFEGPAADIAEELLRPLADEVLADRLGNVIGVRKCGKQKARRLLLPCTAMPAPENRHLTPQIFPHQGASSV